MLLIQEKYAINRKSLHEFEEHIRLLRYLSSSSIEDSETIDIYIFSGFNCEPQILKSRMNIHKSLIDGYIKGDENVVEEIKQEILKNEDGLENIVKKLNNCLKVKRGEKKKKKQINQQELERKEHQIINLSLEKQRLAQEHELKKMEMQLQIEETKLLREREERQANRDSIDSLRDSLKDD